MSQLAEEVLFGLAKNLYKTEIAHSTNMKEALADINVYDAYRSHQVDIIINAARTYGIDFYGKYVLDLGCNDGAITPHYIEYGAKHVFGIDIDEKSVARANDLFTSEFVSFHTSKREYIPLNEESIDVIICYDVFEHVSHPESILNECRRILRVDGKMLIGTWGWYHPFAPHLWATMPVPWAHVLFSEKTLLRVCRRVYNSPWYVPIMHDFDENGKRITNKYSDEEISSDYLNKLLLRDYERCFQNSGMDYVIYPQSFGSKYARWTKVFLGIPWLREFLTSYIWVVLKKTR